HLEFLIFHHREHRTQTQKANDPPRSPNRNFREPPMSKFVTMISVKQAGAVGWSEVSGGEAALIQRCAAGDEMAFAELVGEHQRLVVQLAINLLGDRDEALDLSQEVFLRVFRTIARFRGQSTLR